MFMRCVRCSSLARRNTDAEDMQRLARPVLLSVRRFLLQPLLDVFNTPARTSISEIQRCDESTIANHVLKPRVDTPRISVTSVLPRSGRIASASVFFFIISPLSMVSWTPSASLRD